MKRTKKICVLGAGVVGLTTAVELQSTGLQVTLIADKFDKETTSNGAAGIFRPSHSFSGSTPTITKDWIEKSYKHYSKLLGKNCGIAEISGYMLSKIDPSLVKNDLLNDVVPEYRDTTQEELRSFPGNWKYGSYFRTLLIECAIYLPWLLERFKEKGGEVMQANIKSFSDLKAYGTFDLIVNCTGLGAKQLCNDSKMVPISGQVYKVEAPWLDKFYYGENDTYIIPGINQVTLGGTRRYDSAVTEISKHSSAEIWENCTSLVPELKSAKVIREWVGLRPHRDGGVRVEAEILKDGTKVVHNYGHGGYGVTSAPGTAKHAVRLVVDSISSSKL